ncbi:GNAT family N-acetyltransferase [Geomicrobium sp. JCM 19039]|uniref:GNAT family N-acetyltransferase n=1 Tax=Geomicrobium sp. JCM 19039 TaxID=1460636 RepID=UPI00045F3CEC|nr:GNAT family N-acetyltransferase [Geomicrobium sp. JCM 19039]GAK10801.1 YqjY protein [Geomicrobium sp. JCM 19039]
MKIRHIRESDYDRIVPLINDWWAGRQMADMVPRLFFDHFQPTSFIADEDGEILGFLIGFLSPARTNEAYIHFVGVDPNHRQKSIGKNLYEHFFSTAQQERRSIVRAVTSPVNEASIAYHVKMGFSIERGKEENGIHIHKNYDGPGQDRVRFVKELDLI